MAYDLNYNRYLEADIFGTSGLPNVYVDSVNISNIQTNTTFSVTLNVYELATSGQDSLWYLDETIRQYLLIRITLEGNVGAGDFSEERDISPLRFNELNEYTLETLPSGDIVYKIPYEEEFSSNSSIPLSQWVHASFKAQFIIDYDAIYQDFSVSDLLSYTAEESRKDAIKGSNLVTEQTQYLTPDGDLWLGAVHKYNISPGQIVYMAGPGPHDLTQPHPILTPITVSNRVFIENTKEELELIIDFTQDDILQNIMNIGEQTIRSSYSSDILPEAFISNQYQTRTKDDTMSMFFSINFKDLFVLNSNYGYFYTYLKSSILQDLMKECRIKHMRLTRQRKDIDDSPVILVGESNDEENGKFKDTSALQTHLLGEKQRRVRTFLLTDDGLISEGAGEYAYRLEMWLTDPIYDFLSKFYDSLTAVIDALTGYYGAAAIATNYDYTYDQLSSAYQQSLEDAFASGTVSYSTMAENSLKELFAMFSLASTQITDRIVKNVVAYLKPETASLASIHQTIEIFQVIKSNFEWLTNTRDPDADNNSVPNGSSDNSKNLLMIAHDFETFDMAEYLDYLIFMYYGHIGSDMTLDSGIFDSQYQDDIGTYIGTSTSWQNLSPIDVYNDSYYSFFSLKYINLNDSEFETYGWTSSVYEELMSLYNFGTEQDRSLEQGFSGYEAAQLLTRNGLTIDIATFDFGGFGGSGFGFGSNFDFGDYQFTSDNEMSETLQELYKSLIVKMPTDTDDLELSLPPTATTLVPFQSFVLLYAVYGMLSTSDYAIGTIARTFAITSDTVWDPNITTAEEQIKAALREQLTKFTIYIKYGVMAKVEYLADPTYSDGIKDPNWFTFSKTIYDQYSGTGQKLFCRLTRIVPEVGFPQKTGNIFDFNLLNSYFVLQF